MRILKKILLPVGAVLLVTSAVANATTPQEREGLSQIAGELNFLKSEVVKVGNERRSDDVEAFNYEALLEDIDSIQSAIERHIKKPSRQPRQISPLEATKGYIR